MTRTVLSLEPDKDETVKKLLAAKKASGKTWDEIADAVGLCNAYTSQLFRRQAQLKENSVEALKAAVPELTDDLIEQMKRPAFRYWDERVMQEPHIYRMTEVCTHYGETIPRHHPREVWRRHYVGDRLQAHHRQDGRGQGRGSSRYGLEWKIPAAR